MNRVRIYGKGTNPGDTAILTDGSNGNVRARLFDGTTGSTIHAAGSIGDGMAAQNALDVLIRNLLFNGTNWDRQRGNTEGTLLASAARTAETNSSDQINYNARGLIIFVDVSAITATPVLTPRLQIKDSISGNYFTVWSAATAITATGQYAYLFEIGGSGSAGSFTEAVNLRVGRTWRFQMGVGDADSATYSVSEVLLL